MNINYNVSDTTDDANARTRKTLRNKEMIDEGKILRSFTAAVIVCR